MIDFIDYEIKIGKKYSGIKIGNIKIMELSSYYNYLSSMCKPYNTILETLFAIENFFSISMVKEYLDDAYSGMYRGKDFSFYELLQEK